MIEILIVIVLISILAAIAGGVASGMIEKAKENQTKGTIEALMNGMKQYFTDYREYPDVTSSADYSAATATGDANRRLYFLLQNDSYTTLQGITGYNPADEPVKGPYIKTELRTSSESSDGIGDRYLDAWDNPLYVSFGRDHSNETPAGPNNSGGLQRPLDIISYGSDEELNVDENANGDWADGIDDIVSWRITQ